MANSRLNQEKVVPLMPAAPVSSDDNGNDKPAGRRKKRPQPPQERIKVEIGPTEAIRRELGLSKEHFSEKLGFNPSTYAGYAAKGWITKTAAIAARSLLLEHEQQARQASGEVSDRRYFLVFETKPTGIKAKILAKYIDEYRKIIMDNRAYFLVPTDEIDNHGLGDDHQV